jgi:hypothetical protein
MTPQSKEIYLARAMWGFCRDMRPCVVIELTKTGWVKVALLSSAMDLYRPVQDFLIDSRSEDFLTTGLNRTSYVSGEHFAEIPIQDLGKKRLGILTGELAGAFDEWM